MCGVWRSAVSFLGLVLACGSEPLALLLDGRLVGVFACGCVVCSLWGRLLGGGCVVWQFFLIADDASCLGVMCRRCYDVAKEV